MRGLAIVAAVGFLVPLLLGFFPRLRLPSVVLEIAAGAVLGPSLLGWVEVDEPIRIFSHLGFASLLFLAGLEVELEQLKGKLLGLAVAAFFLSLLISAAFCLTLRVFGIQDDAWFLTIILVSSAIGLVVPVLKDAGEMNTPLGQLLVVAISIADFGAILLLSLLFSAEAASPWESLVPLATVAVLCVSIVLAARSLSRWNRLAEALLRLQDTTSMIRVRGAALFLLTFVVLIEHLGLEIILGAFAAGVLLGTVDRDFRTTHPQFHSRLQAIGFGIFIPVFFVASGLELDLRGVVANRVSLASVPVFLAGLLLIRGAPALLYRKLVGSRRALAAGLLQATSLPLLVAGAHIGMELGKMTHTTAAALILAGAFSVLIFPSVSMSLLTAKQSPARP